MYKKPSKLIRFVRKVKWLFGIYLLPQHIATVDTLNGLLSFNSKDRTLGRQLYVFREFEYHEMIDDIKLLRDIGYLPIEDGGRVMDVGGYVGMISVGFLKAGIFDSALAIEPNPSSFALLEKNAKQNHLGQKLGRRNIALSDASSVLTMELSHKNFGDNRIRSSTHGEENVFNEESRKTIDIEAITLDEFYQREPGLFDDLRLIWMDIQGHEGKFFAGGETFFKTRPGIPDIMEFWPYGLRRSGVTREEFCHIVRNTFTHFHTLGDSSGTPRDIADIEQTYDRFAQPHQGAHLIFINNPQ